MKTEKDTIILIIILVFSIFTGCEYSELSIFEERQEKNKIKYTALADYTDLRDYTGKEIIVEVTKIGIAGMFQLDENDTLSMDNGGTVIIDNIGRCWKRIFDGALHVTWFGTVGDGKIDDTNSFQAAINTALNSETKALYVKSGNYYCPSGLVAEGEHADRLLIYGDGRSSDIWSDKTVSTIDIKGVKDNSFQHAYLQDICVRNTNTSGTAVRTRNTEFFRAMKCTFSGGLKTMIMSEYGNEQDTKPLIYGCIFSGGVYGLKGGETRIADATIRDNTFINCTTMMIDFGYLDGGTIVGNKIFSDNKGNNSVVGIRLLKPIYAVVKDNDFFELGGSAIVMTTPRHSRIIDNRIVNVGQKNAAPAILIQDYPASITGIDVHISGNTLKDVNGNGLQIYSAKSLQKDYIIEKNEFHFVGDSGPYFDAIALRNCNGFRVANNQISGGFKTRYWLYLDASKNIELSDNKHVNCINADVYRINNPTMIIKSSERYLFDITSNYNLLFDDDGVFFGTLTSDVILTLPSAASCPGKTVLIGKTDATIFKVTITPPPSQRINGVSTFSLETQFKQVRVISDGANWIVE